MNNRAADKSVWLLLLAIFFSSSSVLFAGNELPASDGKDYSKEVVPVEKSWCETPVIMGSPHRRTWVASGYFW